MRTASAAVKPCQGDSSEFYLITALQVLRRLGSIFTSVYATVQKLKKDSWKELQFSLVDNSKLNVLNAAPVLEVENFTNLKKRFICHIIGIDPQFENIISNGPYIPMAAGQWKPKTQWTPEERKAANLDKRLKSLIMFMLLDDQMNSVINYLTAKSTWDDLILYREGPSDVKKSRVIDLKLCYNTFKFIEGESLTQTFTKYKPLMNELVNDGIKLSKLEINAGFINGLPKKWLAICQSLRNTNHVKESKLASLFDFQESPDDEEDLRSSQEYMNDLDEEYQARDLLAKSKRFFKMGTQRSSSAKATDQTECYMCGKKGHFARDYWHTKDFKAKYNKVKGKLALLSSSALAPSSSLGKNKGLIAESYDWDEEEVSSDGNDVTEVKALMALGDEERVSVSKESDRNGEWIKISMKKCINEQIPTQKKKILGIDQLTEDTSSSRPKDPVFVKSSTDNLEVSVTGSNKPKLSEAEDSTMSKHDTSKAPSNESQRNITDHLVVVSNSSATDYDSANESSVCSTHFPPLEKLTGAEPVFGPKTIKSILKSKYTFKAETLKAPADYLICEICRSYDHDTHGHNRIISLRRGIKPRNPQHVIKICETRGSNVTTSDHNDIEWFRKREAL
ncbi:retrovirus-related pol polyprotein from transposon TNT 1-94 [Tanacetum coccineum]|uniref:Retrovirus-related pol polyprotein from transposon TNT 1-94 n=1 Tax=Tanacetum coccineum TaxID=301880 RepID=A0ABQ5C139_9ASTR